MPTQEELVREAEIEESENEELETFDEQAIVGTREDCPLCGRRKDKNAQCPWEDCPSNAKE